MELSHSWIKIKPEVLHFHSRRNLRGLKKIFSNVVSNGSEMASGGVLGHTGLCSGTSEDHVLGPLFLSKITSAGLEMQLGQRSSHSAAGNLN